MAWIKEITDEETGQVVRYWEMFTIFYEHTKQLSTLRVGGWVNKEAYYEGKSPTIYRVYFISSGLAPQLASGAKAFVTQYALSQEEFSDAEVVNE